jgi:phosphomannomutase
LHTKGNPTGALEQRDLWPEYKKHVLQSVRHNLRKKKIAIDASNGMAGKAVPILFADLPLEMREINFEHTGKFKHDPDPLKERSLASVKAAVRREGCDFGVCFDGDADRLVLVDEMGSPIGSDLLTALLVPYFLEKKPKSAIVYDLRSSRVVMEEIIKYGGTPRRERVGHSYMKKAMRDTHAVFGGELSGHYYYEENYYADSAMITLVHVLNVVDEKNKPVSELIQPLRRYSRSGEISFEVDNKQAKMEELTRRYSEGQADYLDGVTVGFKDWWFNCRPSSTQPLLRLNVEAKTRELLEEKLREIEQQLGTPG